MDLKVGVGGKKEEDVVDRSNAEDLKCSVVEL
jgi:hypothetical protein